MGRRPPDFDLPSSRVGLGLSRVASALREALKGSWGFAGKAEALAAEPFPGRRIHFESLEQRLLLSGEILPAAASLITKNGPGNNQMLTATLLPLTEDPVGSGLAIGRGEGRLDPAVSGDCWSASDWWRLDLQMGDVISVSVDTPASDMDPYLALNDGTGSGITSDDNIGPGTDAAISLYTVPATGVYYIQVGRYGNSPTPGDYELHVERTRRIQQEYDPEYCNARGLSYAIALTLDAVGTHRTATVAGSIMVGEDQDVYILGTLSENETLFLSTRLPSDSTLAPAIELRNSSNVAMAILKAGSASAAVNFSIPSALSWRSAGFVYEE